MNKKAPDGALYGGRKKLAETVVFEPTRRNAETSFFESFDKAHMTATVKANEEFFLAVDRALRHLFEAARAKHELYFAMSLMAEHRGMQEKGWCTSVEAERAFDQYAAFLETLEGGSMKCRIALSFYCHMSEASGFYEVPKNMLRVAGGERHSLTPLKHLVQGHKLTGEQIAPNANTVLKDLIGHAKALGFQDLAEILRDVFDPDVRNAYAHADYVVWPDGLHLPKRNGGMVRRIPWEEFNAILHRAMGFFTTLRVIAGEYVRSYSTPKKIRARMGDDAEIEWTISYEPRRGSFRISSGD